MAIPSQTAARRARSPRWALTPPESPGFARSPVYRPRRPTETPHYPVVQHHLETFLAEAEQPDGCGLAPWVEHDFRRYLTCGILAHGFARLRCDACAQERLLAFSCKGRGVCPSCTTRRMAEVGCCGSSSAAGSSTPTTPPTCGPGAAPAASASTAPFASRPMTAPASSA